ncbi:hypothetical protein AJ80_06646 [Polytolypa hystricis UAMH7299]|uniref:3-hydroxyisobutyrate dehydrogenase n=1 Tax=Polytolypa hystricis (strain UAMH7299) TaxID=1447883 RepID=A0A2B7XUM7_POLH7|nr:hypothetical protein AJ80_06646 [Polytolypa hystricis UAMH7299]
MASEKPTIGFVGLGAMGFGMATNLISLGYKVRGYDVWAPTLERFKQAGGEVATSLANSAAGNAYFVCMVASAPQVQSALFDDEKAVAKALPQGAILILCSTVPATYAQSVRDQLIAIGRNDIHFIDAPVSGGAKRAADGTLSIMAGASDEALEKGKFLLAEMSDANKLYLVPGGVGAGSNMKMVHQVLAAIHILAASEAMGFAAQLGLDAKEVREAIVASEAWSWMHENRSPRMLEEDYFPGVSALTIILKDVGIITATARHHNFPVPLCTTAEQTYLSGLIRGFGPNDDAGMVRMYYSQPISNVTPKSPESSAAGIKLVLALLTNIHICAAAEAVSFAKFLNVDMGQFYELVNAAAGGSEMFKVRGAEMIEGAKNGTAGKRTLDEAAKELSAVVQQARDLHCPLHLGNEALNLLLFAKRRGWGELADTNIEKVYEAL